MSTSYQDITFTLRMARTMAEALEALLKSLHRSHKDNAVYREKLKAAQALRNQFEAGVITNHNCHKLNGLAKDFNATIVETPEAAKDILRYFKKNHIDCIPMVKRGESGEKQYAIMFSVDDTKMAQRLINRYNAEHAKGCVSKGVLFESTRNPKKITGLSQIEVLSFMKQAERYGLPIYVEESTDKGYTVVFDGDKKNKVDFIRAGVAYEMGGPGSSVIKAEYAKEISQYNNAIKSINQSISEGEPVYMADSNGAILWTDPEMGAIHYEKDGKRFHIDVNDKEMATSIGRILNGMQSPTVMTGDEYRKYASLSQKEREKFRQEIEERSGSATLTKEEAAILRGHEEKRSLIEKKLLRESPGSVVHAQDITNDQERMSEYDAYNKENLEFTHDEAQTGTDPSVIYDDAAYYYKHYIPQPDNRDFEKEQELEKFAEELFKEDEREYGYHDDFERDLEPNLDDVNENNILDEQEMDW